VLHNCTSSHQARKSFDRRSIGLQQSASFCKNAGRGALFPCEVLEHDKSRSYMGGITYYSNRYHIYPPYTLIAANEDAASIHSN
jgi:hypothetical protein